MFPLIFNCQSRAAGCLTTFYPGETIGSSRPLRRLKAPVKDSNRQCRITIIPCIEFPCMVPYPRPEVVGRSAGFRPVQGGQRGID